LGDKFIMRFRLSLIHTSGRDIENLSKMRYRVIIVSEPKY